MKSEESCLSPLCVLPLVLRWRELSGMREARKNHGLVVVNNRIYAIGGQGTFGNDLKSNISSDSVTCQCCNSSFTVLRLHVVLFVGGLESVEYYDIASNEWQTAAPMPWRGVTVKCAAVGDIIYVLAGFQGVGRLGHVLEYHTDTDRLVYVLGQLSV